MVEAHYSFCLLEKVDRSSLIHVRPCRFLLLVPFIVGGELRNSVTAKINVSIHAYHNVMSLILFNVR